MSTGTNWKRLGDAVVNRRVELGMKTRAELEKRVDLSYRLLSDLETGKRGFAPATYAIVEQAIGWEPGSSARVLDGGEAKAVTSSRRATSRDLAEDVFAYVSADSDHGPTPNTPGMVNALWEYVHALRSDVPTSTALQRLADKAWVSERVGHLPAEDRQAVKHFIDQLGRKRFDDWDHRFITDDIDPRSNWARTPGNLDVQVDPALGSRGGVTWSPPSSEHEAELEARLRDRGNTAE
ncbi:helix-turn-helix domain-containing protein [Nocardia terpenica]|nr:helix-turn-helix transcriptional regulator [Nocardia terpenica]NQE89055.1 helix-turn-helix transcriptional regulator [Nocardia terpenica]